MRGRKKRTTECEETFETTCKAECGLNANIFLSSYIERGYDPSPAVMGSFPLGSFMSLHIFLESVKLAQYIKISIC